MWLEQPLQSSRLTVSARRQSTCPSPGVAAELHHTKEQGVAARCGERVPWCVAMRSAAVAAAVRLANHVNRRRRPSPARAYAGGAARPRRERGDEARFGRRSFLNELAAEGMARERRYDDGHRQAQHQHPPPPPPLQRASARAGSAAVGQQSGLSRRRACQRRSLFWHTAAVRASGARRLSTAH